jgi:DNA invertase Pin-like site-specific DNA recombinase
VVSSGRSDHRDHTWPTRAGAFLRREGDELVVHSMDRLARSLVDLRQTVDVLTAKGVRIRFAQETLT